MNTLRPVHAIHTIAGLADRHGGPSYSVPRMCAALVSSNVRVELLTVSSTPEALHCDRTSFPADFPFAPILSGLRFSRRLKSALEQCAIKADIIHNHGLWLMPNVYAGWVAQRSGAPLIVSPRGMLAPAALRFSRLKKQLFWAALQGPAFHGVRAWHATSCEEAEDIRSFGIKAPIAVIPNGVDDAMRLARHNDMEARRTLLFLSRLHPKKGLPNLISAWARVAPAHPDWRLVIAGPDEAGHEAVLRSQATALSAPRIEFVGPVYGVHKEHLIEQSDLFVLPTLNENFGLAVAEALCAAVPAIVTKGAPWAGLVAERCGWWIDHGVEPLATSLDEAMSLPAAVRRQMGYRGRAWMRRDFSWEAVAGKMIEFYSWVCRGGERPAFVC